MAVALDRIILDPPVFLAPMAGITDAPFRALVGRLGAGLVVSEMVASAELLAARPTARSRAELGFSGCAAAPTAVQLAGRDPGLMAAAARLAAGQGARIVDINMGCPAKKVTSGWSGSALMREPEHALRVVAAVVAAVDVPVTLKMRLGWDDTCRNAADIARRAEAAGVRMITVHGRTRCQFYAGRADWDAIRAVRDAVAVPVIANGDIADNASAGAALARSGAAGAMIGRGVRGRPWLLGQLAAGLAGRPPAPAPQGAALRSLVAGHYEAMLGFYGRALGARVARKHLGWYLEAAGAAAAFRRRLLTAGEPAEVERLLREPWPAEGCGEAAA